MNDRPNPMRWNCEEKGCFNRLKRPKLEQFWDCFHGKIKMSDVDGIVEINNHILMMEWKSPTANGTRAQEILAKRFTANSDKQVYIEVRGDAETMEVDSVRVFRKGRLSEDWRDCDLEDLRNRLKAWGRMARGK